MLLVGLTGGIAAGKSTVARRLATLGGLVIDADLLAREVVEPGTPGLARIVAEFGPDVLTEEGSLDRPRLGEIVFGDPDRRAALNAIVHPAVSALFRARVAAAPPDAIVVHDVPLLVENGLAPQYHLVVVVSASAEVRARRLVRERGLSVEAARRRIDAQADDEARQAVADVLLDNERGADDALAAVDALWRERLVPYEENVRLRRPAARPGGPVLADPDPGWPSAYARLAARIRRAGGDRVLRVDHVGSTAVPELPAKDVLDLQVSVRSMADADLLAPDLEDAGFARRPDIAGDTPKPGCPDPVQWEKRLHEACDPGRAANVHVRVVGSAGWRFALAFRDWLRAEESWRGRYLAEKRRLVALHARDATTEGYAEAKEPWFERTASPALLEWIAATGWTPADD